MRCHYSVSCSPSLIQTHPLHTLRVMCIGSNWSGLSTDHRLSYQALLLWSPPMVQYNTTQYITLSRQPIGQCCPCACIQFLPLSVQQKVIQPKLFPTLRNTALQDLSNYISIQQSLFYFAPKCFISFSSVWLYLSLFTALSITLYVHILYSAIWSFGHKTQ